MLYESIVWTGMVAFGAICIFVGMANLRARIRGLGPRFPVFHDEVHERPVGPRESWLGPLSFGVIFLAFGISGLL